MAEEKGALQSAREWVVEHKLRAIGVLWLSGIAGSIAYNWSRPGMKTNVKLIHASSFQNASFTYQPRESRYVLLDDGRKLCLECIDSAVMDTNECQTLDLEIQEFYEGLNMKVEQQVPLLLVQRQALNEAMEGEKAGHHHLPETRGLCLSEEDC